MLIDFHSGGGAVFLFADNVLYMSHVSEFLYRKFGITLTGDYQGNKTLVYNETSYSQAGCFDQRKICSKTLLFIILSMLKQQVVKQ